MEGIFNVRRFFWVLILIGLSYLLYYVIYKVWTAYETKPLSFTVDTNYLNWTTTFPAVSVCEIFNTEKMWDINERLYGPDRNKNFDDFMTDITFFGGLCYSCKKCLQGPVEQEFCAKANLTEITKNFRTACPSLLANCKWNDEPFNCCDGFIELQSEFGVCYTINSMHTKPQFGKRLLSDRTTGPGRLDFIVLEDIELYLHSSEDVPSKNSDRNLHETILWGVKKEILFSVVEIINEEHVEGNSIGQRKCQFHWEMDANDPDKIFDYHSYSTCIVECIFRAQLNLCGCTHHLMPKPRSGNSSTCDIKGLLCLSENYMKLIQRRKDCNCVISCSEQEINIIYSSNDVLFNQFGTIISLKLIDLPKIRYIRKTVRSMLDFIISLGGIFGLFFGASLITFIEFVFKAYKRLFKLGPIFQKK